MARGRRTTENAPEDPEVEHEQGEEETSEEGSRDLYAVLGLDRGATQVDIKKAYHRMALKLHPDKNPGDEKAKEQFQTLQHVISVLGNPEKRKIYDETGSTEDAELSGEKFQNLYEYYRNVFRKVSTEEIDRFFEEYRGSEEETRDLKELYTRFKGDMDLLYEYMLCSDPSTDNHRFKATLEAAIEEGELKSYKCFKTWAKEVAKKPPPANPLKPRRKRGKSSAPGTDLVESIKGRQAARAESLLDSLAAKYGGTDQGRVGGKGKKRMGAEPDISDEEFAAIQSGLMKKKGKSGKR